ncbi:MAG TPA: tetratricopeptide repeat protein, partial [Bacteroidia bacterium]|nr:tetratricopeptide repeat protein [Bacteroidia bacterium]
MALLLLYPQFASADDLNKKINLYLRDTHSAQAADYVTSIIHHYLVDDEVSDSAIMWSDTLRNLGEAKGDLELVAKSDVLTGKYYLRIANDAKALDYFYRALKYYKSVDNLDGEADIYLQIGLVYYLQGQFPDALPNIKLATELYQKTSNDSSLSTTYYLTGLSYLELKNYKQAEIFLQQSLKIGKLLSNNQREYECYVALARLYT